MAKAGAKHNCERHRTHRKRRHRIRRLQPQPKNRASHDKERQRQSPQMTLPKIDRALLCGPYRENMMRAVNVFLKFVS